MQINTTFVSAEAKTTQYGTMYVFKETSGGNVATKDAQLAAQAQQLLNQPVIADIAEVTSQKINEHTGRPYVNRYLNSITPGSAPQSQTLPGFTGGGSITGGGGTFTTTITPPSSGVQIEITARDRSIWAQSASKVAAELLRYFPEAEQSLATFDNLVHREIEKYAAHHKGNVDSEAVANGAFAAAGAVPVQQNADQDIPF